MSAKKHKTDENEERIEELQPQDQPDEVVDGEEIIDVEPEADLPMPIAEEEIAQLRAELNDTLKQSKEYLEGWQRERAEFFNYKKRLDREQAQGSQNAIGNALRRYLDIADDLARALKNKNRPTEGDGAVWADGIELIYRKMLAAFEADGIKMMATDGKYFDPNLHEAISHEDSPDHESGEIIEVVQPGYMLGERVLRPARVRVAR